MGYVKTKDKMFDSNKDELNAILNVKCPERKKLKEKSLPNWINKTVIHPCCL